MSLNPILSLKKIIAIMTFSSFCILTFGQKSFKNSFESSLSYGRILAHRNDLKSIILNNSYSFEASMNFLTNGSKPYHYHYIFPTFGWTIHYTSSGNTNNIGNIISTYGSIKFPLSKKIKPLCFRLGLGAGWVEKKFDLERNYKNLAIGSNINLNIQLKFEKIFSFKKQHEIKYAILLNHLSNGSYKRPNLGLNIFQIQASHSFGIKSQNIDTSFKEFIHSNERNLYIYNISGFKENKTGSQELFYINETAIQYEHRKNIKSSFSNGIDILNNYSIKPTTNKILQIGINIGHSLNIGNIKINTQLGCHIYNKGESYRRIYNKITIDYLLTKRISTRLSLRSHLFSADFAGIGVGYKLI